jgi:retinol-binding protein 3
MCAAWLPASAKSEPVVIPDTPAGQALAAWLDAFDSGERARIEAYLARYEPGGSVERTLMFRKRTGGFQLVGIDRSDRLHVDFCVQEKASPTMGIGQIEVKDADPPEIVTFTLQAIPPGMSAADAAIKVDAAVRRRVIDGIVTKLTELYVFPDVAKAMVEALRARETSGEYDASDSGYAFASQLTQHLQAVSHDKHLRVQCVPMVLPKEERDPLEERPIDDEMRAHLQRDNCGFEKVERLERNIGYVKFNFFGPPAVCGATATAAMHFLAHTDAVIFDLRDNRGGAPEMVAWVSSYLFEERTHLNDLWERKRNRTTEYWTRPDVPGPKLAKQAVYVLTSKNTFSGAEEFTYNLKNLKRATIVGETTGGGAHPTAGQRVDDHFLIGVPFACAINPISKTSWQGEGVEPDVKVPADQALDVAKELAAATIDR